MSWKTLAQADSLEALGEDVIDDFELPHGTKVRWVLDLNVPVGYAFSLPGAEYLFRPMMPEGIELTDVRTNGHWGAIIEGDVDPAWLIAALAFVRVHWLAISLIAIGLGFVLAEIIKAVRFDGDFESPLASFSEILKWGAIGLIGVMGIKLISETMAKRKS